MATTIAGETYLGEELVGPLSKVDPIIKTARGLN